MKIPFVLIFDKFCFHPIGLPLISLDLSDYISVTDNGIRHIASMNRYHIITIIIKVVILNIILIIFIVLNIILINN